MTSEYRLPPQRDPGKWASIALAVFVHGILLLALFFGIRWQTRAPETVEVEVFRSGPVRKPVPKAEPKPLPPPQPRAEPKPEAKPQPKAEPKPEPKPTPPKPDIATKEKEKPKPPKPESKPVPKAKPEPKPEPKLKPDTARQQKLIDEQLRRDTQQLAQQRMQREAEREMAMLREDQAAAAAAKGLADWTDKIRRKIRGNIVLPPGVVGNPEALFDVSVLPDGSLLNVKLRRSSGNSALDSAIERAIRKSDPLPKPETGTLERELNLKFRPLED